MHDFYCRRGCVHQGCWLALRADILACILPLTTVLFSALTFPALLRVSTASACSLPGAERASQGCHAQTCGCAVMCAVQRITLLTASLTMVRRSLRAQSHVGDRSLCCSKCIASDLAWAAGLCIHEQNKYAMRAVQLGWPGEPEHSAATANRAHCQMRRRTWRRCWARAAALP